MSQRKIMKTVIALEKKVFYRENIACLNRLIDESQSYNGHTEDKTFDLLVEVMTSLMRFGREGG